MFTFAVVGFGARGRKYSALLQKKGARLVAVCDKDKTILEYAGRAFGLEKQRCTPIMKAFLKAGRKPIF